MIGCRPPWHRRLRPLAKRRTDPRDLLPPLPAEPMRMWPISTRVNKPENDDPSILEPMELCRLRSERRATASAWRDPERLPCSPSPRFRDYVHEAS